MINTGEINWDVEGNTAAPSWMGSGAYAKWTSGDPDYDANDPQVKQNWWRGPSVGGGIVWHPYYGWQDRSQVKNMYKQSPDGVSLADFQNWGLSKNMGEDWRTYFPNAVTDAEGGGGYGEDGGGPMSLGGSGAGGNGGNGGTDMSTTYAGQVQNPNQWDTANSIYDYFGTGGATSNPWQYDAASKTAYGLANGAPVDQTPAYQAMRTKTQYDITDAIRQAAEQAGIGNWDQSSMLGNLAQQNAGRSMADLGAQTSQMELAAQQQNRDTQQGAANSLFQYGQGQAGLVESAKDRAMNAAGGLSNLGSLYGQYPLTVANQAYQMGTNQQQTAQKAASTSYQDWLRTTAENNPFLQMIYGMATGQGVQQQYGNSTLSDMLGIAGSFL